MRNFSRRSFLQFCQALSAGTLFSSFTSAPGRTAILSNTATTGHSAIPGHTSALGQTSITSQTSSPDQNRLQKIIDEAAHKSPSELTEDETFWAAIREAYFRPDNIINFNNAGMAPAPIGVLDQMKRYADFTNELPSLHRRALDRKKDTLRANLARIAGCSADELAIQRNATEAMETIIFGLPLKAGDEVILAKQDYPNVINAWKQREKREGIKLLWVDLQLPSEDNDYLAGAYTKLFTRRTKVVNITHMINWNGQILPVRKIADVAHNKGIEVVVDGAQTFGQLAFAINDLGADYFGASLHKWFGAPLGTGILYVKKEKIKSLFALFAPADLADTTISKFEHFGTHPVFIEESIQKAIEFHEMVGAERKEQRLFYLKNYWMEKVKDLPGIQINTSTKPGFGCGIGMVSVKGRPAIELEQYIFNNYKIHAVSVIYANFNGCRFSPNIYTSLKELDLLIDGMVKFFKPFN